MKITPTTTNSQAPNFKSRLSSGWVDTLCKHGDRKKIADLLYANEPVINKLKFEGPKGPEDVWIHSSELDENNTAKVIAKLYNAGQDGEATFKLDLTKTAQEKWDDYIAAIKVAISKIKPDEK